LDKQVDVDIQGDPTGDRIRARWFICDNGMTVADGIALVDPAGGPTDWQGSPPPADHFGAVAAEIDHAVKRRQGT